CGGRSSSATPFVAACASADVRLRAVATATVLAAITVASGCSSGRPAPAAASDVHGHPDLAAFLRLPVASPSACPPNVNGATAGRRSPWVGTVDVSVFVQSDASAATLRPTVPALPVV